MFMSRINSRTKRIVAGVAVLSAFAAMPVAAQAADEAVGGVLTAGALTFTTPVIDDFAATLTGVTQTAHPVVGAWAINDATGSNLGYSITVSATAPTVGGSAANAGTGASLTMTSPSAVAVAGNPATLGAVSTGPRVLSTTASAINRAAAASGQGSWTVAGGSYLDAVIPGNASAGAYLSTLTYTAAGAAAA
jgi:hypothetical protein